MGKFFNKTELQGLIYHAFYLQEVFTLYLSSSTKQGEKHRKSNCHILLCQLQWYQYWCNIHCQVGNYIFDHCCVFTFNTMTTSALLYNEKPRSLVCERCHIRELQKSRGHPQILYKVLHCSIILFCITIFFPLLLMIR